MTFKVAFQSLIKPVLPALLLFNGLTSSAQHFDVTPVAGYFFDESFPVVNGEVVMHEGPIYGGILSYGAGSGIDIELQYFHRPTSLEVNTATDSISDFNITSNWIFLNGCYNFDLDADGMPFIEVGMGWVNLNPEDETLADDDRFALAVGLGFKYRITDRLGLRLSTNVMSTMNSSSSAFLDPNGEGTYVVNKMTYVTQFGFRGGLYVRLFDK